MAKKRKVVTLGTVRLYSDQADNAQIIRWLEQFDDASYGAKQQAIKAALLRGIQVVTGENQESGSPAAIDWVMLRQVIDSAIASGLARTQVAPAHLQPTVEAESVSRVDIAGLMGTWNDDDE